MKTISVVIPTMWKNNRLIHMIPLYQQCPFINEIIIIDNSNEFHTKNLKRDKVTIYTPEKNIFVNPAWNMGVKLSSSDIVCIINDDISVDIRIFEYLSKSLPKGIIAGPHKDTFNNPNIQYNPSIEKTNSHTYGWGTFITLHKEDWIDIPKELKVFYGDVWLFEYVKKECRIINNFIIHADMNSTVTTVPEVNPIHIQEIETWKTLHTLYQKGDKLNWY